MPQAGIIAVECLQFFECCLSFRLILVRCSADAGRGQERSDEGTTKSHDEAACDESLTRKTAQPQTYNLCCTGSCRIVACEPDNGLVHEAMLSTILMVAEARGCDQREQPVHLLKQANGRAASHTTIATVA